MPRKKKTTKSLFEDQPTDDKSDGFELKVNEKFAERFEHNKRREELHKLKELEDSGELVAEDDTDSEEEDEDGVLLTKDIDEQINQTITLIRRKDPVIYTKDILFFNEEEKDEEENEGEENGQAEEAPAKKEKPMYLKDYVRKTLLEHGDLPESSDEEEENAVKANVMASKDPLKKKKKNKKPSSDAPLAYTEEQEELRMAFKDTITGGSALGDKNKGNDGEGADEDDDDLFTLRKKTAEEKEVEEADFQDFVKREQLRRRNETSEEFLMTTFLRTEDKDDAELDECDRFLRDYVINKRWIDTSRHHVPTYEEIVGEDEEEVEKQEQFERKYNFRFEEPGSTQITTFGRTIEDSVRRKSTKRKEQRKTRTDRKEKEKQEKMEELKRLKNLKRAELMERVAAVQKITGETEVAIDEGILEEDFDPDKYDQAMQKMFGSEFYDKEADKTRPVFEEDAEIDDFKYDDVTAEATLPAPPASRYEEEEKAPGETEEESILQKGEEEEGSAEKQEMENGESTEQVEEGEGEGRERRRGRKRKRKGVHEVILEKRGQLSSEAQQTLDTYLDEYYRLNYEDLIGDVACRFKYQQVPSNDFGLKLEDILTLDDKDLNRLVSLKKLAPYRGTDVESAEANKVRRKVESFKRFGWQSNEDEETGRSNNYDRPNNNYNNNKRHDDKGRTDHKRKRPDGGKPDQRPKGGGSKLGTRNGKPGREGGGGSKVGGRNGRHEHDQKGGGFKRRKDGSHQQDQPRGGAKRAT